MRDTHPTKVHLTETAAALIDEFGSQGFTVDQLLEKSNISKGSLYHHFEDFPDVIMQAQVSRFARYLDDDVTALTKVLLAASSREDMFSRLDLVSRAAHDPARSVHRADRIEILASALRSEKMKKTLAPTQARITSAIADLVREMKSKKFVSEDVDDSSISVFIQAYSLGLIVNDVSNEPIDLELWHELISRMTRGLL